MTRIANAEANHGRTRGSVSLVAVSKTRPASDIADCHALGQRAFGENYLNDALPKIEALSGKDLEWHFIGHIQSNKCQEIAKHFEWVHSIERMKIAQKLNDSRPLEKGPLNVFLQVNLQGETSKSGVPPSEIDGLAKAVADLENLKLRGLMAIPAIETDETEQRKVFAKIKHCQEKLNKQGLGLDCLSMGMTGDMEAAIAEGATHVRIGTAIFGPRPAKN